MDKEEAVTTLLSDSDDEEENIYKMFNGASSGKNGTLLMKKYKGDKGYTTGCLLRGALVLSFVLNVVLFTIILLSKNTENVWNFPVNNDKDKPCKPHSPPSTDAPLLNSSKSSIPAINSSGRRNFDTDIKITQLQQQQQQQQQKQQHQAASASCTPTVNIPTCGADRIQRGESTAMKSNRGGRNRGYENVFADLTPQEMKAAYNYLLKEPKLNVGAAHGSRKCTVMSLELHTPNKTQALLYMDSYGPKPPREAQALIACEYSRPPVIKEIVVGPLPDVTYHLENPRRKDSNIPYKFAPTYGFRSAFQTVFNEFASNRGLEKIVSESYGVTSIAHCKERCIIFLPQKTSSAYNKDVVITITAFYATEFTTINPLDLIFVTKEMMPYGKVFIVSNIFYGGKSFESSLKLIQAYNSGTLNKTRMSFPRPASGQTSVPGSMNLRGTAFPSEPQDGPRSYEPDGKRYSIKDQHVNYLQWSFNMRLGTVSGPQLWDVKWGGERIAYEVSLQDVGVLYAGANPMSFYAHLSDSAFGLGNKASGLLPGLDCPEGATFLSKMVFGFSGKAQELPHSQCVFEHNTERPLRRHRNMDGTNGFNHGGLVDRVLIVRSVIVEYNYDYIFDMIFHQNGALELKTFPTGYIMSQHYFNGEKPFGFKIHGESVGSIHHHIFNYKIDLDILGTSNRYETLDLAVDERPWPWYHGGKEPFKQISFLHNLRKTESEAILRYNYSQPKYHIVYNEERRNAFGNHRAYRIATQGFTKQVLPDDSPVLNSRRWAKYDMLVTRRKDAEERSSSMFSMFDGSSPHVDIDHYLQDNETIVDEDLVFWITVGMHHIPHTEDIPNTPTVGTGAAILLTPYNYFRECPSTGSRDSIRVDRQDGKVVKTDYGVDWSKQCVPTRYDYKELFSSPYKIYT